MIHVKIEGKLYTFKDLAQKYELPTNLIAARYKRGLRKLEELIQPKYNELRK